MTLQSVINMGSQQLLKRLFVEYSGKPKEGQQGPYRWVSVSDGTTSINLRLCGSSITAITPPGSHIEVQAGAIGRIELTTWGSGDQHITVKDCAISVLDQPAPAVKEMPQIKAEALPGVSGNHAEDIEERAKRLCFGVKEMVDQLVKHGMPEDMAWLAAIILKKQ